MASMRSDRARARARDLLASVYPVPDDAEFDRLRQLAIDYIREAERLEAGNKGRAAEPDELISAALDAVARDYFSRALIRAMSQRVREPTPASNSSAENSAASIAATNSPRRTG